MDRSIDLAVQLMRVPPTPCNAKRYQPANAKAKNKNTPAAQVKREREMIKRFLFF